jgi:3-hydroxyisobutyrate dehydrogenase-like beta-hydroxyacid dehydrogenase
MERIGFVGLGVMGGRMVERLLRAGHDVIGHNRTRSKAQGLLAHGMRWAASPRAVAEEADVVFSMVTGNDALRAITGGDEGVLEGLRAGSVFVDMSTVAPALTRELAERVARRGAAMLDAPVSGSVDTLERGELTFMVAGEEPAFERVRPLMLDIGRKATFVGGHGKAVAMKIATNLNLAVQMLAFSESVLLAERSGIARETAMEVLLNSVVASPMICYRGPFVSDPPEEAWFDVTMMQKDMNLALELGQEVGVMLPTTATTNELLTAARGLGLGEQDFAVVFEVLARLSGGS